MIKTRTERRKVRHNRVRARVIGTAQRPRLSVFKSNKFVYAQLIDDEKSQTLGAMNSKSLTKGTPKEKAKEVGLEIAKIAKDKNIEAVVFDRGGFIFTGIVKELAEGAREGGLKF